jgi:methyl-accepting chemotaxis protein
MNFLYNLKIGRRLALGFAIVLGLSILTTVIGILKLNELAGAAEAMLDEPIRKERLASDWSRNINIAVVRTSATIKSADLSLTDFFAANAAETSKSSSDILKKLEPLLSNDQEKQVFAQATEVRKVYLSSRDLALKLKKEGKTEEAEQVITRDYLPAAEKYLSGVAGFLAHQRTELDSLGAKIAALKEQSRRAVALLAALSVAFGIVCSWWLTRSITGPLASAVATAENVAAGDLTGQLAATSNDEIGQLQRALQGMNANLLRIVSEIRTGSDAIATASSEIASGNLDLSSRTEQQAGSLQETASSMEELNSTVSQSAENARQASTLAVSASEVADRGGVVVAQVVDTMASINASSKKIVDIIAVIDGIAFQTNILALNAAVEAARAGEQGRGFAVVASEVRNLAQRSAAAAKEIKVLINDSVSQVDGGARLVDEAGATMQEIVGSVRRVTDIIGEISAATQEQTSGIGQINHAIAQMDQATQQNAALVEEAAAASRSMQEQAAQLAQAVSVFKLDAAASQTPRAVAAASRAPALRRSAIHSEPSNRKRIAAGAAPAAASDWEEF